MTRRARRNHSSAFKAKVAIVAIKGDRTIAQIAEQFDVHPNQVTEWKQQLESSPADVFVERLWRSVNCEEVYLHAYDSVGAAREGIGRYLDLYNRRRPHSSLDGMTPDQAYFGHDNPPPIRLAA